MKEDCPNYKSETSGKHTEHYCIFRYWGCWFKGDDHTQCQFYEQLLTDEEPKPRTDEDLMAKPKHETWWERYVSELYDR